MTEKSVPDYAHIVVVPIANPTTAPELIKLAEAFVRRDGGRVIALAITISDSDAEVNRDRLDKLEAIVEGFQPKATPEAEPMEAPDAEAPAPEEPVNHDEGKKSNKTKKDPLPEVHVEFFTRSANSIARGILDQVREVGAELIVLGVQRANPNSVEIGVVAQSVMSAAPCDVLVYRHSQSPEFSRIVVPVDGTAAARMAVRVGILFGNAYQGCPVEAIHVRSRNRSEPDARALMAHSIDELPGSGIVKRSLVTAHAIPDAILSRTDKDHLIIMGFTHRNDFQEWLEGSESKTRRILDAAPGPVLLAVRSTEAVTKGQRMRRRVLGWVRPQLTDVEQEQIVWTAQGNASLTLDYVVLLIVSATLASLGLLLNSAAVIIGAMLVAPLMAPLNAFAIGLSTAHFNIMRRAFITALAGFLIASVVGILIGVLVPSKVATTEMASRVSPTLLDAFVALASGVVGSYATARRDIPAALAGVAIAAALVPPICTFGLQVAFGNAAEGLGAALLFLTNIISIVVIATGMFVWLGLYPRRLDRSSLRAYIPIVILVLMSLPMVVALLNTSQRAAEESRIETVAGEVFAGLSPSDININGDNEVTVTIYMPYEMSTAAVAEAERRIEVGMEQDVTLRVVVQETVTALGANAPALPVASPFTLEDGVLLPAPPPDDEAEGGGPSTADDTDN